MKKETIESMFKTLRESCGISEGTWILDKTACYGGWVIAEKCKNGGESHPFGTERRSSNDFYDFLRTACRAISVYQDPEQKTGNYWPQAKEMSITQATGMTMNELAELQEQADLNNGEAE